jgi:16S rRNA (cytosine1402-N4)-methyltransferase
MVIGVDADMTAIEESRAALGADADRVTLVHSFYDEIPAIVAAAGLDSVQGVLFDLGVSSPQLDDPERGFAYSYDAPLDMRMDQSAELTAEEIVNRYPAAELARVLRDYGEERFARRIADALVRERSRVPVTSTSRLSEIVRDSIPAAARRTGGHPAKRTFQALRIEVNGELAVLGRALPAALDLLSVGGRIAVLAYHSLEDRVVKRALAGAAADTTPPGLPVPLPERGPQFRLLTRGAMRPTPEELTANPRAASARLRGAERIRKAA